MNYHWAQDAVQDALLTAYRYLKRHPSHEVKHPKAWFCTLTRHEIKKITKRFYQATSEGLDPQGYIDGFSSFEAEQERASELYEVMSAILTAEEIELLHLIHVDKKRYQDLADQTGKPVGTLRSKDCRARKKVRDELARRWQQDRNEE